MKCRNKNSINLTNKMLNHKNKFNIASAIHSKFVSKISRQKYSHLFYKKIKIKQKNMILMHTICQDSILNSRWQGRLNSRIVQPQTLFIPTTDKDISGVSHLPLPSSSSSRISLLSLSLSPSTTTTTKTTALEADSIQMSSTEPTSSTISRKIITTTNSTSTLLQYKNGWLKHLLALFMTFIITSMDTCVVAMSTNQGGIKTEPLFISRSEAFKFVVGETISLPCEVTHPGQYVLAWKRGIAILTAGTVKVTPDPRVRLINGYTLQIRDATPQDAGDYICQIATIEPREITHHVEILVPPKIHHVTSGGHLQVKKGSPVRLECAATGNPTPNITWTRKNNVLPNGEDKYVSPVYVIENMDRHKGGVYICTANNGVGQAASSQIILHVLYPPEITVEKPIVYSGEGQEAILVCIVHGESQPEVMWFKDTMQIDTTERHIMENRGARHTLIIRKVYSTDFGNYSCVADNQLGKTRKTITLTGKPSVPTFRSAPISQWKDKYNISWIVNSHAPIEEYKLYYRPTQNAIDNTFDLNNRNFHSHPYFKRKDDDPAATQFDPFLYNGGIGGGSPSNFNNGIHWSRTEWRDVILPAIPLSHRYTQGMSYVIRGIEPDQQYEAKVQARNRFGWSEFSEPFVFSTTNVDTEMRDLSVTHYSSTSSSSSFLLSSAAVSQLMYKSAFIQIFIFCTFKIL